MRIDQLLARQRPVFSVEFFPPKTEQGVEQLFETVDALKPLEPDYVSVTYGAGGATRDGTVEIAERISTEHGLEVMAHLSCVGETRAGLTRSSSASPRSGSRTCWRSAAIRPAARPSSKPPMTGSRALRNSPGSSPPSIEFTIGGACFPEVHPEADDLDSDLDYLKTKVAAGAGFLITQLFFDNRVYFDFVEAARERGIDVPIIPGVIPITSFGQVARICDLCDATIPADLDASMSELGGDAEAEALLGVAYAARQCEELLAGGAPGIHFYALNRAPGTRAVLAALRASRPWERAEPAPGEPAGASDPGR